MFICYLYAIYYILYIIYIYILLLNYWRKRFSVTLQTFNARLITQAYLVIFDNGGGNLERDFCSARAFEMLSA